MSLKHLKTGSVVALLTLAFQSQALEVHEWGTFTSLINEKGVPMGGMHHEEEGLLSFVYGLRAGGLESLHQVSQLGAYGCTPGRPGKCAYLLPEEQDVLPYNQFNTKVTQKMETPVIYFYGKEGEKAQVEVKFPEGMISQWFPAASSYNLHLEQFKQGFMSWDVTLKGVSDTENYPKTRVQSIWNPARQTKANTIKVENGEEERFIFYRGLADFHVPLKIALKDLTPGVMEVTISNPSQEAVPALFYLRSEKTQGVLAYLALPAMKAGETKSFLTSSAQGTNVREALKASLMEAGLFADEAESMLNTWNRSYFHTTGERLLYVLPASWTETILPLTVTPKSEKLVRVLVGRVELFSQAAQKAFLKARHNKSTKSEDDHLSEAKLNAAKAL